MSRDYKNTTSRKKPPARKPVPGWLWLFSGLLVGLLVALLIFLSRGPAPATPAVAEPPPEKPVAEKPAEKPTPAPEKPRAFTKALELPKAEPPKPPEAKKEEPKKEEPKKEEAKKEEKKEEKAELIKPRFEFYTLLPESEVVVPEQELSKEVKQGVPQVEKPGLYLLQAGSFRSREQADQLKAKIAFLGLSADIQPVTIANKETWYRVRVGPFTDLRPLNDARVRLKEQNIDALLLKLQDEKKAP